VEKRGGSKMGSGKCRSGIVGRKLQGWKMKDDELWKAKIIL